MFVFSVGGLITTSGTGSHGASQYAIESPATRSGWNCTYGKSCLGERTRPDPHEINLA